MYVKEVVNVSDCRRDEVDGVHESCRARGDYRCRRAAQPDCGRLTAETGQRHGRDDDAFILGLVMADDIHACRGLSNNKRLQVQQYTWTYIPKHSKEIIDYKFLP